LSVDRGGGAFPQYFFKSTDYGDTWTAGVQFWQLHNAPRWRPIAMRCGMLRGTSGFGAGQVLYFSWRNRSVNSYAAFSVSRDQGATWPVSWGGGAASEWGKRLMLDPNDQSILYTLDTHAFGVAGPIRKFTGDGAVNAGVQTAWGNCSRAPVAKYSQANTMMAAAATVLKRSLDGGTTVSNVTVDGNIAGGGTPLNWDWNRLMAIHSYVNGVVGTRYFQITGDGGTIWYNKHGNMAGNFNGLVNVGFSLDN